MIGMHLPARPSTCFRHDALQSPDRQIRLLSILPSPDAAVAQYSLQTYILNDSKCPYFHALSYEWGPPRPTSNIAINGTLFKVRPNLRDFLDLVRSAHEDFIRPLWIDAICIDQTNTAERNAQVKIMGSIFQSAHLVMTWLGRQDFADARLMVAAETLGRWSKQKEYRRLIRPDSFDEIAPVSRAVTPPLVGTGSESVDMWTCIRLLCEQSFWTRCWIVQEQIKAQKLLLLWGYQQIPWATLAIAFRTVHAYIRSRPERASDIRPWTPILSSVPYKVWLHVEGNVRDHPLLELMETYRSSDCSVEHDKAYALTGISSDFENIQVDYDKSLPDLYVSLIQLMQQTEHCLKYSHLILKALRLDPLSLSKDNMIRGQSITCEAHMQGQISSVTQISASAANIPWETKILRLTSESEAIVLPKELEAVATWARLAQETFTEFRSPEWTMNIFRMSNGGFGVALSTIMIDDCIYALPGIIDGPDYIFLRAESSQDPVWDGTSSTAHPRLSSVFSSSSPTFSDSNLSPITRVWLMDGSPSPERRTSINIPLPDLVALDPLLGLEVKAAPPSPVIRQRRATQTSSVTTHHGARSDPIGFAIDEAMRGETGGQTERASTWPTEAIERPTDLKLSTEKPRR